MRMPVRMGPSYFSESPPSASLLLCSPTGFLRHYALASSVIIHERCRRGESIFRSSQRCEFDLRRVVIRPAWPLGARDANASDTIGPWWHRMQQLLLGQFKGILACSDQAHLRLGKLRYESHKASLLKTSDLKRPSACTIATEQPVTTACDSTCTLFSPGTRLNQDTTVHLATRSLLALFLPFLGLAHVTMLRPCGRCPAA